MAIGYRRFPCLIPQDQPLFLYKSSFDNTPKRFFLCVWPKTPGVDRAIFIIRKSGNGNELVLQSSESCCGGKQRFWLVFDKTCTALDQGTFLSDISSGHPAMIGGKPNRNEVVFNSTRRKYSTRRKFFQDMCAAIVGSLGTNASSIDIATYMNSIRQNKATYCFALYLEVSPAKRERGTDTMGKEGYLFERTTQLPNKDLLITGILYSYEYQRERIVHDGPSKNNPSSIKDLSSIEPDGAEEMHSMPETSSGKKNITSLPSDRIDSTIDGHWQEKNLQQDLIMDAKEKIKDLVDPYTTAATPLDDSAYENIALQLIEFFQKYYDEKGGKEYAQ